MERPGYNKLDSLNLQNTYNPVCDSHTHLDCHAMNIAKFSIYLIHSAMKLLNEVNQILLYFLVAENICSNYHLLFKLYFSPAASRRSSSLIPRLSVEPGYEARGVATVSIPVEWGRKAT